MWALTLYHFEMYRFACIFHSLARYLYLIRKEEIKYKIKQNRYSKETHMQCKRRERRQRWRVLALLVVGVEKFDIESNAINLGFAIQSTLASLYFMCVYMQNLPVFWLA